MDGETSRVTSEFMDMVNDTAPLYSQKLKFSDDHSQTENGKSRKRRRHESDDDDDDDSSVSDSSDGEELGTRVKKSKKKKKRGADTKASEKFQQASSTARPVSQPRDPEQDERMKQVFDGIEPSTKPPPPPKSRKPSAAKKASTKWDLEGAVMEKLHAMFKTMDTHGGVDALVRKSVTQTAWSDDAAACLAKHWPELLYVTMRGRLDQEQSSLHKWL